MFLLLLFKKKKKRPRKITKVCSSTKLKYKLFQKHVKNALTCLKYLEIHYKQHSGNIEQF